MVDCLQQWESTDLSIHEKIGINLNRILLDIEIVLQLALVETEFLVERLRPPEVIVEDLQRVQDVGHLGHQLCLRGITFLLRARVFGPEDWVRRCWEDLSTF